MEAKQKQLVEKLIQLTKDGKLLWNIYDGKRLVYEDSSDNVHYGICKDNVNTVPVLHFYVRHQLSKKMVVDINPPQSKGVNVEDYELLEKLYILAKTPPYTIDDALSALSKQG